MRDAKAAKRNALSCICESASYEFFEKFADASHYKNIRDSLEFFFFPVVLVASAFLCFYRRYRKRTVVKLHDKSYLISFAIISNWMEI